jgi:hypothetical protein
MTQANQIINHMKEHGSITGLQALKHYGCFRLAARIYDLRSSGYQIESQRWKTRSGKTVARYWLKN